MPGAKRFIVLARHSLTGQTHFGVPNSLRPVTSTFDGEVAPRKQPIPSVILSDRERGTSERESKDPANLSRMMPSQGVSTMLCLRNRISRLHVSATSSHRGLIFSIKAIFFSRRQPFSWFSRLLSGHHQSSRSTPAGGLCTAREAFNGNDLVLHDAAKITGDSHERVPVRLVRI